MQREGFWKPQAQEFQTASRMEMDLRGPCGVSGRRRYRQLLGVRLEREAAAGDAGELQSWQSSGLTCRRSCLWPGHGLANFKGVLGHGFIFAKR